MAQQCEHEQDTGGGELKSRGEEKGGRRGRAARGGKSPTLPEGDFPEPGGAKF